MTNVFFISSYTFPKGQVQVWASKDRFFLSEFVTEISLNQSIMPVKPAKLSTKFCQKYLRNNRSELSEYGLITEISQLSDSDLQWKVREGIY